MHTDTQLSNKKQWSQNPRGPSVRSLCLQRFRFIWEGDTAVRNARRAVFGRWRHSLRTQGCIRPHDKFSNPLAGGAYLSVLTNNTFREDENDFIHEQVFVHREPFSVSEASEYLEVSVLQPCVAICNLAS